MVKRVTIEDVAALAGVHKGTVSRALNSATSHQVSGPTVRRVEKAARQLGYVPNVMARGLRTSLSMTVGVIVPDLTNPIFPPILRGIESHLSEHGYTALIVNTDGKDSLELAAFESLLARHVDGLILATGQTNHPFLDDASRRDVRVVLVNRGTSTAPYPLVTGDDGAGMTAAVEHLVQLGHRHVAHIAGPEHFSTSLVRRDAFLASMERHPEVEYRITQAEAFSISAGEAAMDLVLASNEYRPTAVLAGNDLLALGTLRSLRAHGIACPEEISVVGFDDMPFAADFNPPLTTVRLPHHLMGVESARLLLEGIAARKQIPVNIVLPVGLVVRESTGPAPRS